MFRLIRTCLSDARIQVSPVLWAGKSRGVENWKGKRGRGKAGGKSSQTSDPLGTMTRRERCPKKTAIGPRNAAECRVPRRAAAARVIQGTASEAEWNDWRHSSRDAATYILLARTGMTSSASSSTGWDTYAFGPEALDASTTQKLPCAARVM